MTSVLRRKRRITVRNTPPARVHDAPGLASDVRYGDSLLSFNPVRLFSNLLTTVLPTACWLALAMLGSLMPAMADQWTEDAYPVKQVSYSTGQSGHKLTWLPSRPAKSQASDGVRAAQHLGTAPPVTFEFSSTLAIARRETWSVMGWRSAS